MPIYRFQCNSCHQIDDMQMSFDDYIEWFPCGYTASCRGEMRRQWTAPAIGMVNGGGNSPARPSKG